MKSQREVFGAAGAVGHQRITEQLSGRLHYTLPEEDHIGALRSWRRQERAESLDESGSLSLQAGHIGNCRHGVQGWRRGLWVQDGAGSFSQEEFPDDLAPQELRNVRRNTV